MKPDALSGGAETLGAALVGMGEAHADRPLLVAAGQAREVWTGSELARRASAGAARLRARRWPRGAAVFLLGDPSPTWVAAWFAIAAADLVVVPLPETSTEDELRALMARVSPVGMVVTPPHLAKAEGILAGERDGAVSCDLVDARALLEGDGGPPSPPATARESKTPDRQASDVVLLTWTSGSTAEPRLVELTHAALLANARALVAGDAHPGDQALLSMLSPAHLFAWTAGILAPLLSGGCVVFPGTRLPHRLPEIAAREGVNRALVVPALLEALLAEWPGAGCRDRGAAPLSMLFTVGGAALDPSWWDRPLPAGVALEVGYGLTEAGPVVARGRVAQTPRGSVGRPLAGVEVAMGEDGEILVRTPAAMRGYSRDPVATRAARRGGWLRTGDRGRQDEAGFLYVQGRVKEILVTASGETISPDEVEPRYRSPLYRELCAAALPGEAGNDRIAIVVVPRDRGVTRQELEREFRTLRAGAPPRLRAERCIVWPGTLPRTPLGKVRRGAVRQALRRLPARDR